MRMGIMQGRLSPPQGEQLQFFPQDWRVEFKTAQALGFEAIEWIVDEPYEKNPLVSEDGRSAIRSLALQHEVLVQSVCADIFMKRYLNVRDSLAVPVLVDLLRQAAELEVSTAVIPFVEGNVPASVKQFDAVVQNISNVLTLHDGDIELVLEIDLPVKRILSLMEAINSPRVGVCYDTGNAMTFGFDAGADIRRLGKHLKEVHIKDRLKGTRQSVYLGEGSVDFPDVFAALQEIGFDGFCVLQAWRGEDYLGDAKRQLGFIRSLALQYSL